MDESRKRTASSANAKNINSSLDEDFGNDFLSSWKLPKSGKDTIDFSVDSVPKGSKKFNFDNLDDFGLDGAFDKLSSFKMGMSDLDFSSPVKKKVKHNTSNGDDLSEGKKETEKDNFSFSFDFNELGKFNLDSNLGSKEKSMSRFSGKANPVSTEGNKDTQRGLSAKGTDILEDNNDMNQTQTQDVCTLRPHLASHESLKNASLPTSNVNAADSSDKIQEHTIVNPARVEQTNVDSVSNGEHSKDACLTKAAVKIPSQNFSCSAVSGEDPTQAPVDPVSSKDAPIADFGKVHISSEGNDNEQSISSQSRDTSTVNPNISTRPANRFDSRNEAVEESVSQIEGSHGNQCFSNTPMKLLKKTSRGTKNTEEGTSALKSISSSMQRETRNVESAQTNERGGCALSKTAIMKASRVELTSETALNQLSGASKMTKNMTTDPTDLKRREHKQANAGPDKCKTALSKINSMPVLHGLLTTSMNVKGDRNAKVGLEPSSPRNSSLLNARNSTGHSTGQKNVASHLLRKTSNSSDSLQGTTSEDNKISTISQLSGARVAKLGVKSLKSEMLTGKESVQLRVTKGSPVTSSKILNSVPKEKPALPSSSIMQKIPEEPLLDPKAPMALKRIVRSPAVRKSPQPVPELVTEAVLGSGSPKAIISSVTPCEMGDISDLELPALLENDGNVEKAEACRKELEDICILLKRKHTEAKELAVRAIVNNNMMLMLNHPMLEEKICALQKFATDLRSKKYLFEEVGTIDAH